MLHISKLMAQGAGLAPVLIKRAATVELDWDVRQKSRFEVSDSQGRTLGIFLPRGTVARGGDVLVAEDGSLIRVLAAPQAILKITACPQHGSAFDLIRAAYHLGNRHVPIELQPDHLKIEPDHVLADMLRAMHLIVSAVQEPFEPENGAYATGGHTGGHRHSHDDAAEHALAHSHEHPHDHDHGHDHAHGHSHSNSNSNAHTHTPAPAAPKRTAIPIAVAATPTPHVHGPGCGHQH